MGGVLRILLCQSLFSGGSAGHLNQMYSMLYIQLHVVVDVCTVWGGGGGAYRILKLWQKGSHEAHLSCFLPWLV
jgi:hypothetical protein